MSVKHRPGLVIRDTELRLNDNDCLVVGQLDGPQAAIVNSGFAAKLRELFPGTDDSTIAEALINHARKTGAMPKMKDGAR